MSSGEPKPQLSSSTRLATAPVYPCQASRAWEHIVLVGSPKDDARQHLNAAALLFAILYLSFELGVEQLSESNPGAIERCSASLIDDDELGGYLVVTNMVSPGRNISLVDARRLQPGGHAHVQVRLWFAKYLSLSVRCLTTIRASYLAGMVRSTCRHRRRRRRRLCFRSPPEQPSHALVGRWPRQVDLQAAGFSLRWSKRHARKCSTNASDCPSPFACVIGL